MSIPTLLRRLLLVLAALLAITLVGGAGVWWWLNPSCTREIGVVYGTRAGQALTMDVVTPSDPNGHGILLMMSGSWKSKPGAFRTFMAAPLIRRGYTVFAVYHISQPTVTIMEVVEDVHRAARFVRHHSEEYGVDPDQIGVTGASSGGHLSLMLGTGAGKGPLDETDPVDRERSAVQAVAIFFPVTDLLNLGSSTENPGDGGPPIHYVKGFGPEAKDMAGWKKIGRAVSPIYHIDESLPPVLIVQGAADTLTPPEQSEWFRDRARKKGKDVELTILPGKGHGWYTFVWDMRRFANWFDRHLRDAE